MKLMQKILTKKKQTPNLILIHPKSDLTLSLFVMKFSAKCETIHLLVQTGLEQNN
jgi:hypothetical protein